MRRWLFASCLVVVCLTNPVTAQRRTNAEIATAMRELAAELERPEIVAPSGLAAVLAAAPAGATLTLHGTYAGNYTLEKSVVLQGDAVIVSPNVAPALTITGSDVQLKGLRIQSAAGALTNDLVAITGARVSLTDVVITGNGATKRGIAANGSGLLLLRTRIESIGRIGQESQAIATWDGTSITIRESFLEAGSTSFLTGGAGTRITNHVPADILIEDSTLTHRADWRSLAMANKTGFEAKNGRRITVRRCILENVWVQGQTGFAITLTPSNSGTPSPLAVVEDVLFENNVIRNVGSGANILGFTQSPESPTLRAHNLTFRGNRWTLSRALYGGHGVLMQLGIEPMDLTWENNIVVTDGAAFIRVSDRLPVVGLRFTGNSVNIAGTYGIFTPLGSRGGAWVATILPALDLTGNTFTEAHAIFKTQFPANTYQ